MGFKQALDYFKIPLGRDLDYEIDHVTLHEIATNAPSLTTNTFSGAAPATRFKDTEQFEKTTTNAEGEATTAFCTDCLKSEDQPSQT